MPKLKRRRHREEFKREAVKLVTDQGYSLAEAARNLGIHVNLLRSGMELVGVSQVMKLFVSVLFVACVQARDFYKLGRHEHKPPIVPVFLDEWHNIADRSLKGIIETASGLGIQFLFANQDPSQLKTADIDLSATVWENGGNKVIFTARDPGLQKSLMEISGEQTEYIPSYAVSHPAWKAGRVTPQDALHVLNGQWAAINVAAQRMPRLDRNALIQMSTSSSQFMFVPAYAAPEVGLDGFPLMLNGQFAMSQDEYHRFQRRRWPEATPETIVPAPCPAWLACHNEEPLSVVDAEGLKERRTKVAKFSELNAAQAVRRSNRRVEQHQSAVVLD